MSISFKQFLTEETTGTFYGSYVVLVGLKDTDIIPSYKTLDKLEKISEPEIKTIVKKYGFEIISTVQYDHMVQFEIRKEISRGQYPTGWHEEKHLLNKELVATELKKDKNHEIFIEVETPNLHDTKILLVNKPPFSLQATERLDSKIDWFINTVSDITDCGKLIDCKKIQLIYNSPKPIKGILTFLQIKSLTQIVPTSSSGFEWVQIINKHLEQPYPRNTSACAKELMKAGFEEEL